MSAKVTSATHVDVLRYQVNLGYNKKFQEIFVPSERLVFNSDGKAYFTNHPRVKDMKECESSTLPKETVGKAKSIAQRHLQLEQEDKKFMTMIKDNSLFPNIKYSDLKEKAETLRQKYAVKTAEIVEDHGTWAKIKFETKEPIPETCIYPVSENVIKFIDDKVPFDNLRFDTNRSSNCMILELIDSNHIKIRWIDKTNTEELDSAEKYLLKNHNVFGFNLGRSTCLSRPKRK